MANRENSDCGINFAYNEMISEEDAENSHQDKEQVYMSMLSPGAGLRRPRLLAASLTLLAAVLLLVDIGVGVHYSKLKDGHITFDDVTHINHELIRLQDDYKIAIESVAYANKQRAEEINQQQLSKWELEHQMRRKTDSEAQAAKLQTDITALQTHLTRTSEGCRRCLPGWVLINSQCYHFTLSDSSSLKPWQPARDYCKTRGGDLVMLDSSEKQVSIVNYINYILPPSVRINDRGFWIGLRDVHDEGTWKWLNGRTLVEGYWYDGEPNNIYDEDCAAVYGRGNPFKTWNDVGCIHTLRWICEMAPRV